MSVRVTKMETGLLMVTIPVCRSTGIKDFKELIEQKSNVKSENQRLFFAGKELENQYKLSDYGINNNYAIQLIVKAFDLKNNSLKQPLKSVNNGFNNKEPIPSSSTATVLKSDQESSDTVSYESKVFKVGDYLDVKDYDSGAWFMAKLIKIKKNDDTDCNNPAENDGLIYVVDILVSNEPPVEFELTHVRPIATELMPLNELSSGDTVFTNYNIDYPTERGHWYDVKIKKIKRSLKSGFNIFADVFVGLDNVILQNCHLMFPNDIYKIKPYQLLKDRTPDDEKIMNTEPTVSRFSPLFCINCKDDINKPCKSCGCRLCYGKENEEQQLMCDECNYPYHLNCLKRLLKETPDLNDDWYCPSCKNDKNEIVKSGGELKSSKKETRKSMSKSTCDLSKGIACVGRTKKFNIVPPNHFGSITGVEVGTTWMFRLQVSESSVHRSILDGIHGHENVGAFSIVLSGGYEDDADNGDEILYTGASGQNLSGNKRSTLQSSDQKLTHTNRALALNCNAKINSINGATAVDWQKGKPVRVVRNYKFKKHSKFAPEQGNRYDGIYKVVKYYPQTEKSGFIVWRFVLRRDDPTPAPWTIAGKTHIVQQGLENIIYPDNYITAATETKEIKSKLSGSNNKRKLQDNPIDQLNESESSPLQKAKMIKCLYKLETEIELLIVADTKNKKLWDACKELLSDGKRAFLENVKSAFLCTCCQLVIHDPVTTKCSHNFCEQCLKLLLDAKVFQCPMCRAELGKTDILINETLAKILALLFPGYNLDR